ncbi:Aspartyl/glutamyl-trna [Globisporangium polare]
MGMRRVLRAAALAASRRSVLRSCSYNTSALPAGLTEISRIPRTPSWSLSELHHEGDLDAAESVLTEAKLRELAELCHLHIDDAKLPSLLKEVEAIIQCTKTIQAMTLNENIDDLYVKDGFDSSIAPLREDVVTEGNCADKVLANAAEKSGYFFKVPKVLQD